MVGFARTKECLRSHVSGENIEPPNVRNSENSQKLLLHPYRGWLVEVALSCPNIFLRNDGSPTTLVDPCLATTKNDDCDIFERLTSNVD